MRQVAACSSRYARGCRPCLCEGVRVSRPLTMPWCMTDQARLRSDPQAGIPARHAQKAALQVRKPLPRMLRSFAAMLGRHSRESGVTRAAVMSGSMSLIINPATTRTPLPIGPEARGAHIMSARTADQTPACRLHVRRSKCRWTGRRRRWRWKRAAAPERSQLQLLRTERDPSTFGMTPQLHLNAQRHVASGSEMECDDDDWRSIRTHDCCVHVSQWYYYTLPTYWGHQGRPVSTAGDLPRRPGVCHRRRRHAAPAGAGRVREVRPGSGVLSWRRSGRPWRTGQVLTPHPCGEGGALCRAVSDFGVST